MNEETQNETSTKIIVAKLDADGIYHGMDAIPADQVTADHVCLPDGCDLPHGKYFWDRAQGSFMPLTDSQQRAVSQPVPLNALAWALLALSAKGISLPVASACWLDGYIGTVDFTGSAHGAEEEQILKHFIEARKG